MSRKALALSPAVAPDLSVNAGLSLVPARDGLSAFEQEIVGVFVGLAQGVGLPKSYGEIYGLLFASAQPLSFNDLQARLELSKGSISQGLRTLREIGAVTVVENSGARREGYVAATELRQLIGAILRGTVEPQLAQGAGRLARAERLLGSEKISSADRRMLSLRLEKLQVWHRKAGGLLPWIAKFLG